MARVLAGLHEPDEPNRREPEVVIRMTVPQEFAGSSMAEFSARRGFITGMDVEHGNAVIRGRLPTSEYNALADVIAAGTRHLGRIERDGPEA
jgi:translation elongation factor EF-G